METEYQYSWYYSVTAMLSNLGLRSLEYRHYYSRLAMFDKIQYGLVAMQMRSYITHHSQYNPFGFRQVFARTDYYRFSFYPMTIVLWNRLPAKIVLLGQKKKKNKKFINKMFLRHRCIWLKPPALPLFIVSKKKKKKKKKSHLFSNLRF